MVKDLKTCSRCSARSAALRRGLCSNCYQVDRNAAIRAGTWQWRGRKDNCVKCGKADYAKGLCRACYTRARRTGKGDLRAGVENTVLRQARNARGADTAIVARLLRDGRDCLSRELWLCLLSVLDISERRATAIMRRAEQQGVENEG